MPHNRCANINALRSNSTFGDGTLSCEHREPSTSLALTQQFEVLTPSFLLNIFICSPFFHLRVDILRIVHILEREREKERERERENLHLEFTFLRSAEFTSSDIAVGRSEYDHIRLTVSLITSQ